MKKVKFIELFYKMIQLEKIRVMPYRIKHMQTRKFNYPAEFVIYSVFQNRN
jgi:hypothetical protein